MTKYARYHARRREAALLAVSASLVCNFCGCVDSKLQIDHVHDDGYLERRSYGHAAFISHLIRNTRPAEFGPLQLLCPECHEHKTVGAAK